MRPAAPQGSVAGSDRQVVAAAPEKALAGPLVMEAADVGPAASVVQVAASQAEPGTAPED